MLLKHQLNISSSGRAVWCRARSKAQPYVVHKGAFATMPCAKQAVRCLLFNWGSNNKKHAFFVSVLLFPEKNNLFICFARLFFSAFNNRFLLRASPSPHGFAEGYRRKRRGKIPIAACSSLALASIASSYGRRINTYIFLFCIC
jgi:hypothetical protein